MNGDDILITFRWRWFKMCLGDRYPMWAHMTLDVCMWIVQCSQAVEFYSTWDQW